MKYQRGELSLFWAAVLVGVVTLGAVGALLSMRHERNLFGETWQRVTRSDAGQGLQRAAAQASRPQSAEIRKCVVDGKVMYSNVECGAGNPTSRKLELRDTKGFEAPQPVPATPETNGPENLREKMIERAVQR
ncbi:MAG: hypothetical protein ACM3WS_09540 [Bacillota bacterium]